MIIPVTYTLKLPSSASHSGESFIDSSLHYRAMPCCLCLSAAHTTPVPGRSPSLRHILVSLVRQCESKRTGTGTCAVAPQIPRTQLGTSLMITAPLRDGAASEAAPGPLGQVPGPGPAGCVRGGRVRACPPAARRLCAPAQAPRPWRPRQQDRRLGGLPWQGQCLRHHAAAPAAAGGRASVRRVQERDSNVWRREGGRRQRQRVDPLALQKVCPPDRGWQGGGRKGAAPGRSVRPMPDVCHLRRRSRAADALPVPVPFPAPVHGLTCTLPLALHARPLAWTDARMHPPRAGRTNWTASATSATRGAPCSPTRECPATRLPPSALLRGALLVTAQRTNARSACRPSATTNSNLPLPSLRPFSALLRACNSIWTSCAPACMHA